MMRALVYACLFILAACSSDSNREQAALDAVVIVYTTAQGSAHGSGVVVGQGLILTAGHVSRGRETFIAFRDGEIVAGKEVKMALEGPAPDLALVYAPTGDREAVSVRCTPVAVGEPLYTVGHPVVSRWTVIWGKVASVDLLEGSDRELIGEDGSYFIAQMPVAPGSSGGPVFDSDGNLVGVATALLNAPMPMGFGSISVPTSLAIIQSPATICEFLLDA
jgi:S1-C subfamily serine protease